MTKKRRVIARSKATKQSRLPRSADTPSGALRNDKKLILFDWGGVISRDTFQHHLMQTMGFDLERMSEIFTDAGWPEAAVGKLDEKEFWKNFAKILGINHADLIAIRKERGDIYDEMIELAKELKKNGKKVAIFSNNTKEWLDERSVFVANHFDAVLNSAVIGLKKPDPEFYYHALNHFDMDAVDALLIDDKTRNTEAAKQLGMDAIVFESPAQVRQELVQKGYL